MEEREEAMITDAWLRKIQKEAAKGRTMNRDEINDLLMYANQCADWETIEIEPAELAELAKIALRALEPADGNQAQKSHVDETDCAEMICPAVGRKPSCLICEHRQQHARRGDCDPGFTGCPACVEVKP